MTQREELKLCPFCGSVTEDGMGYNYHKVCCSNLTCHLSNVHFTKKEWNARAKAQAVPQWIPVSEQMPENEGTYFCLGHNGTPFVCLFRTTKYEGKIWLRSTGTRRIDGITHWMPLPAAPVKDGE